jgi:hypothetical protein
VTDRTGQWFYLARNGDTRGRGRNREIYYRGEWVSARGEETVIRGDQAATRSAANPDYEKAQRVLRRRRGGAR